MCGKTLKEGGRVVWWPWHLYMASCSLLWNNQLLLLGLFNPEWVHIYFMEYAVLDNFLGNALFLHSGSPVSIYLVHQQRYSLIYSIINCPGVRSCLILDKRISKTTQIYGLYRAKSSTAIYPLYFIDWNVLQHIVHFSVQDHCAHMHASALWQYTAVRGGEDTFI